MKHTLLLILLFTIISPLSAQKKQKKKKKIFEFSLTYSKEQNKQNFAIIHTGNSVFDNKTKSKGRFPLIELSLKKFTAKNNYHEFGIYGIWFDREDDLIINEYIGQTIMEPVKKLETKEFEASLRYQYGLKLFNFSKKSLFYLNPTATSTFYHHEAHNKLPNYPLKYDYILNMFQLKFGIKPNLIFNFRDIGQIEIGIPLSIYEFSLDYWREDKNPHDWKPRQSSDRFRNELTLLKNFGFEIGFGVFL